MENMENKIQNLKNQKASLLNQLEQLETDYQIAKKNRQGSGRWKVEIDEINKQIGMIDKQIDYYQSIYNQVNFNY